MKVQVFPQGRMCSLRGAMLMWLVPLFLIVGAGSAVVSYWSYSRMVSAFMDDQMAQLAASVATHEGELRLPQLTNERVIEWGNYPVQVFDHGGRLMLSTWLPLTVSLQPEPGFHDARDAAGHGWRVYTTSPQGPAGQRVQVVQSGEFRRHLAASRAGAAVAPVLILLPLAIFILWGVAGMMSRAVQDIGREAAGQDEHSIAELSTEGVPAEIKPLIASFNSLLTRLRDAFSAQRRFVQDAAHELRTPITAVALQLENVRRDLPAGACADSFAQLAAGVGRAQRLVDQLLRMSRHEALTPEQATAVDLRAQVHESISAMIALADQRRIDLGVVGDPAEPVPPATLRCAPGDLRSVLDNLIENALRYTPEGGVVDVRLSRQHDRPVVEVIDTGPGIPAEMLPRVFDRFFRVPGNGTSGSGLGLAIAQGAAARCGLRIELKNRQDRSGLVARVEPLAA